MYVYFLETKTIGNYICNVKSLICKECLVHHILNCSVDAFIITAITVRVLRIPSNPEATRVPIL